MILDWLIKNNKLLSILGTVLGIGVSFYTVRDHYIQVGYKNALTEFQSQLIEANNKAILDTHDAVKKALITQRELFDAELESAKNNRIIETKIEKVVEYVDRVKIKNECSSVDDSIIQLLNKAVCTANATCEDD